MADSSSLSFNNNDKITTYTANNNYKEGGDSSGDVWLNRVKKDLYGNTAKSRGIAATIQNSTTSATFSTWASKLNGLSGEISLCCMEYISTSTSTDFTPVSNIATLVSQAIAALPNNKITMLKPHIGTVAQGDGFVRSSYVPSDINAFFTNWGARLQSYAQICKDNNIPVLSISCEQNNQTVNTYVSNWQTIINQCKAINPGLQIIMAYTNTEFGRDILTYTPSTSLMGIVDMIGLNYYPSLLRSDLNKYLFAYPDTANGIQTGNINGFVKFDYLIHACKNTYSKKIYLTETGCTNQSNSSASTIYPIYTGGSTDYTDQNTYLNTLLPYFETNGEIDGYYIWHMDSPFAALDGSKTILQQYMS